MSFRGLILIACFAFAGLFSASAQQRIPEDPETVVGKLDNGMTYYVRHNANPKGCADFYIVHNVGALQEEDNQNGLAHFLEHMAFNGIKHYPQKGLFEFLAKEGVRFGYNINAYTSRNETVYNLSNIPLVRESFVDSVMLVLHDWSCDILCEQDALDAERGVISEEWRRSDNQRSRMAASQTSLVYHGAKHTKRSVLGTYEIINNFKREEILDFYHKWYRPDLQAIVVVGDFEPEQMVARIKRMFSDIPATKNPVPKEVYPVPELKEPLFENLIDPDIKFQTLKVIHRLPYPSASERATEGFWKQHFTKQIVTAVVAERMMKASKRSDSPVSSAVLVTQPSVADFYTAMFTLSAKNDKMLEETLRFYTREIKRVLDHGFTKDEFNVAKVKAARRNRLDRDLYEADVTNEMLVNVCKEHFLRSRALASPIELHDIQKTIMNDITYEEASACLFEMFADSEKIYSYNIGVSKKDKLPSVERMKEIIAQVHTETPEPEYITYKKVELDMDAPAGRIVKTSKIKGVAGELWTLSNGAKVYWMPCDQVKSATHLVMDLRFSTGYRTLQQDKIAESKAATSYMMRNMGFASNTASDIAGSPLCSGVQVAFNFDKEYSGINVSSGAKDVEAAFKMVQNYLVRPYFDTEKNLDKYKSDNLRLLGRVIGSTQKFSREQNKVRYDNHPWEVYVDSAAVKALDMNMVREVYDRAFGNPSEMEVFICSDLERDEIAALVEKHIAAIPGSSDVYEKSTVDPFLPAYQGKTTLDKTYPLQSAPKADVEVQFLAKVKEQEKVNVTYDILDYIMTQRCVNRIREERGGTYHVRFFSERCGGNGLRASTIIFQTRPQMLDVLLLDAQELMDTLSEDGPLDVEMENAVKYLVKARGEKKQKNANMLKARLDERRGFVLNGIPYEFDYEKLARKITANDVRHLARAVNNGTRFISVYREQ
ncbi:MAG: insulinase family protein [Bacteroidales bacterium]|nr:insulinase family protein [Bacteroidales bacterium]